jgi:hypothetical protein
MNFHGKKAVKKFLSANGFEVKKDNDYFREALKLLIPFSPVPITIGSYRYGEGGGVEPSSA